MTLGPTIMPVLEQLGLLEEISKISKPIEKLNVANSNLEPIASAKFHTQKDMWVLSPALSFYFFLKKI